MPDREIFRKTSLKRLVSPEDLDELLQVNTAHTWLWLVGIIIVIAGLVIWGFFGSISQSVSGFGIIKTRELPREVITNCSGQVDSVFCKTGDPITKGQRLVKILKIEDKSYVDIISSYSGEIIGLSVREGEYINTGHRIAEIEREPDRSDLLPEVVFFVDKSQVSKLSKGMTVDLELLSGNHSVGLLKGKINFISGFPVSAEEISKYFAGKSEVSQEGIDNYYEVRASLMINNTGKRESEKELLRSMNALSGRVIVTVARMRPVSFLMNDPGILTD